MEFGPLSSSTAFRSSSLTTLHVSHLSILHLLYCVGYCSFKAETQKNLKEKRKILQCVSKCECYDSSLTATLNFATIWRCGLAIIAPPAAVDLEDAIVSGSISVAVDGSSVVFRLPLGQTNPCRGNNRPQRSPERSTLGIETLILPLSKITHQVTDLLVLTWLTLNPVKIPGHLGQSH